jgi:hypothetical protein
MTYLRGTILIENETGQRVQILDSKVQRDHRELYVIQTETGQIRRLYLPTLERDFSPDNLILVCFRSKRKVA